MSKPSRVNKNKCETCPFGSGDRAIRLSPEYFQEILNYLAKGTNHLCHSDSRNKTVCRGGRDIQLKLMCHRGWIPEPTDEALAKAMEEGGIKPKCHIANKDPKK